MKYLLSLLACLMLLAALPGCTGGSETSVEIGKEFQLAFGKSASVQGENLTLKFTEVVEDSRCPTGATCVWAGRASVVLELNDGEPYRMVLTEPGLTDAPAKEKYKIYTIAYSIEPYPELGKELKHEDYRLKLTVSK